MAITVTNQKPVVLDALHFTRITGDFDPLAAMQQRLVDPLTQPLNQSAPVTVLDAQGTDISGQLRDLTLNCLGDTVDTNSEDIMREVLGQTLQHFDPRTTNLLGSVFTTQAGSRHKLPAPSARIKYTSQTDVIPAAKGLLAGTSEASEFFASLAYTFSPNILGFWFETSSAFADFTAWLSQQSQQLNTVLPGDTIQKLDQVAKLGLKELTESLLLRKHTGDGNDEHSFPRTLHHLLMSYLKQQRQQAASGGAQTMGELPFTVGELFCPQAVVFVNVEAHARARAQKIDHEWKLIEASLHQPVRVISSHSISKLTALPRAAQRAAANAAAANQKSNQRGKSAAVVFRRTPPKQANLLNDLTRVMRRMKAVNRSHNVYRTSRPSFQKSNRRDPDDFNKPGKIVSTKYLPDIHIYLDCSGSISEENYQDAVLMLIHMAKKLNVNLYFNSFSNVLSQSVLLKTENKSVARIWKEFRRIPKVTGGTDFKQIWDYVNQSTARQRRLSLVVTDFEWNAPATKQVHPPNLYYAPCANMDWDVLVQYAEEFVRQMAHIDPAISKKLIGMTG